MNCLPGVLFSLLIAAVSWLLGMRFPIIGGPIFGIITGMILGGLLGDKKSSLKLEKGVKLTSKKLLQLSIILLGFEINFFNIMKVGSQSLTIIIITMTAAMAVGFITAKALRVKPKTGILVCVGTTICGGSAIAATAPVIKASSKDVSTSISVVFLFNVVAVFIFPLAGHFIGISDYGFGIWAGTAINDTSSVVAAASGWSMATGNDVTLAVATITKLTRVLFIIPITLGLAFYLNRNKKSDSNASKTSVAEIFPWFIIGFLIAAAINTTGVLPSGVTSILGSTGKFMIVMAMAAIGFNTNVVKLIKNGWKPILMGVACWITVAVISLIMQYFTGMF